VEGITELEAAAVLLVAHLIFHGDRSGNLSNHHCFSTFWLLDLSMCRLRGIVNHFDVASFAMITLAGLVIIWTHVLRLKSVLINPQKLAKKPSRVSSGCYHPQGSSAKDLDISFLVQTFLGIVLSLGFRLCPGALLALLVAILLGIGIAGLLAVLAMSLSTAIMITVLALFSVYRRQTTHRLLDLFLQKSDTRIFFTNILGVIGGRLILVFGLLFLSDVLMAPAHPFR
tara:strand:- start:2080 stop:2763 length:684 start_codon:yes stop_codon:yes gene_type:complete